MAENYVSGHDGGVTMPTAHGGKVLAFSIRGSQRRKETSAYGAGRASTHRGGLTQAEFNLRYLLRQGASNTAPGVTAMGIEGVSITLTSMTGCTHVGVALFDDISIDHAMDDPAVGGSMSGIFNGALVETWATT